jgi:hypothetical protein
MGLFDFLVSLLSGGRRLTCPSCGTAGARKTEQGEIHCKNPACPYYDVILARSGRLRPAATTVPTQGNFRPRQPITVRYRNFAGQDREFVAELESVVRKKNHLAGRVAPTGRRIALSRERIQNLQEVEAQLPQKVAPDQPWPTRVERQVLGYHKKHRSTSPLYEKVRAKYPNW